MRGVVPLGNRVLEIRDIADPVPGPGEAVVELKSAGICGSDLHAFRRTWGEIGERQGLIIGHEACGVVHAVGQGVDRALIGRRVSEHIDVAELIRRQVHFMGSWVLPIDYYYDMVGLMLAAGISFSSLVEARFPIENAQQAFEAAETSRGKVILHWD